ncbi:MAG: hypothetical protein A2096_09765 [Spirochaetes bacterium GWF1_41_5]|nr:MAG: hypothetical protein A2096_09765 [Spirochaetes bacterium GWF1_41_5]HBE03314.1 hypothetical protein [Spirochaetia bacterium]
MTENVIPVFPRKIVIYFSGKIKFRLNCVLGMRCFYICQVNALSCPVLSLKEGYHSENYIRDLNAPDLPAVLKFSSGFKKYLTEF